MNKETDPMASLGAPDAATLAALANYAAQEQIEAGSRAVPADLSHLAEEMLTLKEQIEELDEQKKLLTQRYDELRKTIIPEAMRKQGMITSDGRGSFTFGGGRLAIVNDVHVNVKAVDKQALVEYLKANGAGELVKEEVNSATLKAHCRSLQEEGRDVPPMVSLYVEPKVTLTRSKTR